MTARNTLEPPEPPRPSGGRPDLSFPLTSVSRVDPTSPGATGHPAGRLVDPSRAGPPNLPIVKNLSLVSGLVSFFGNACAYLISAKFTLAGWNENANASCF